MATNPLEMSDEDFLNAPQPGTAEDASGNDGAQTQADIDAAAAAAASAEKDPDPVGGEDLNKSTEAEQKPAKDEKDPDADKGKDPPSGSEDPKLNAEGKPIVEAPAGGEDDEDGDKDSAKGGDAKPAAEAEKAPNYEEGYKAIMAPFTANGKKIELKDPKEAIALMQMGANYTRKLQQLAPARKAITMLENHGLLDETKLSFLIALDKGDPEAIKKLIVDKGIDPLDIDTKIDPVYREGSYTVSDEEVNFRTQMEELSSTDTGRQTIIDISENWDQASKDFLWKNPNLLPIISEQRDAGIYAKITEEMDRQRTLGTILPTTSFIEAYKLVGDQLQAAGAFGEAEKGSGNGDAGHSSGSAEKPTAEVLATRTAEPRPVVDNGDKAGAASPSRSAPGKAKEATNFLAMSDDDFMKSDAFKGRV